MMNRHESWNEWNGMNGIDGIEWNRVNEWNGMIRSGIESNRMEWNRWNDESSQRNRVKTTTNGMETKWSRVE